MSLHFLPLSAPFFVNVLVVCTFQENLEIHINMLASEQGVFSQNPTLRRLRKYGFKALRN